MLSTSKLVIVLGITVMVLALVADNEVNALPAPVPKPCGQWHKEKPKEKPDKDEKKDKPKDDKKDKLKDAKKDKKEKKKELLKLLKDFFDM
ncbi:probable H/ACA ribonucleoprotein complex subunit 4 [Pectinophora gossypiella]|uniref:probable H/ACA ribonucleoprotein complex subunit 4 n=1 Tax=Pectinophora gossypiella TaxID=13191 RepID=UPI00214E792B|nr:probable H/ACA ribonucleoprotein complex subunit 4 [Pectinophora gossypiella]XP_049866498.1 probable H/ACA ribonucleoprotein complex subunit 4 [Pectinophora gossypiella]XP_049866499.1 probable H/ACA ribonucleoprotein complex subunit 4 [Pectinophora gossypiella]XP_049866501.1 probable H/ACA ribonucleoprotein complex subunit 4 [Pectinophora gossypiella]